MRHHTLQRKIMRRVYAVYVFKRLSSPVALRMYTFALVTAALFSTVSMGSVLANIAEVGVPALHTFSMYAVMHTELAVQLLIAIGAFTALLLLRDCVHALAHLAVVRRAA